MASALDFQRLLFAMIISHQLFNTDSSLIKFTASPSVIHPILTTNFQLRCSLLRNSWMKAFSAANPFERYINYNVTYGTTHSTYPETASTQASLVNHDVAHITSIIIAKVSNLGYREPVASVTFFDPPALDGFYSQQAQVQGSCDTSPYSGEQGYLSVTWTRPLQEQSGEYLCEIAGLSSDKHPITVQSNVHVIFSQPTVDDLIGYISNNEMRIAQLEQENRDLKYQLGNWNESSQNNPSHDNLKAQRIQTGVGSCDHYDSTNRIYFSLSYNYPPTIFLSITNITFTYSNTDLGVFVYDVSAYSFTVHCSFSYNNFNFQWMAIDN